MGKPKIPQDIIEIQNGVDSLKSDVQSDSAKIVELGNQILELINKGADMSNINIDLQREVANLKLQQEASRRVENGTTFGSDMNGNSFGIEFMNSKKAKSRTPLALGETVLGDKLDNPKQFELGDEMVVVDDVNTERISITRAETLNEVVTNTVTDASVVNSAYTTSASARPVMLDNGWIVVPVFAETNTVNKTGYHYYYISKDGGKTFEDNIKSKVGTTGGGTSIVNLGNKILEISHNGSNEVYFTIINIIDKTNTTPVLIDGSQSNMSGTNVSLSISPDKTTLWGAWSSKNATYPNSFNIRFAKGVIQVDGSVVWETAKQLTKFNSLSDKVTNPSVAFSNGYVHILSIYNNWVADVTNNPSASTSVNASYIESGWVIKHVYDGGTYAQSNPQVVTDKNGVLYCVWQGIDSVDTTKDNIRFSKSADGGVTWSAVEKLTSGNTYYNYNPTITVDKNGALTVLFNSYNFDYSNYQVYKIKNINGVWTIITQVTNLVGSTSGGASPNPSALYDNSFSMEITEPLFIYKDFNGGRVGFYGAWQTIKETFHLECFPLKNAYKKGAWIAESTMNEDGTFPKWDGNIMDNNVQDATVVSGTYSTSGNGGRKLVRLSNGWLVAITFNPTGNGFYSVYKSEDNGDTWSLSRDYTMNSDTTSSTRGCSVVALKDPTRVLVIYTFMNGSTPAIQSSILNLLNGVSISLKVVDSSQNTFGDLSAIINDDKTEVHACWSSKNSSYPNSFNLRYSKGVIQADGSVVWDTAEQVTIVNNATSFPNAFINPSITLDKDGVPTIISSSQVLFTDATTTPNRNGITIAKRNRSLVYTASSVVHSSWSLGTVYDSGGTGTSYIQSNPSTILVPSNINGLLNGRIWVAWHGKDSTMTLTNIYTSYSDNGGLNWASGKKITNAFGFDASQSTISSNIDNEIFIVFKDGSKLSKLKNTNGLWGSPTMISNGLNSIEYNPSSLVDYSLEFSEPLFVYANNTKVGFYGHWSIELLTPLLTATANYRLPLTDYVGAFIKKVGVMEIKAYLEDVIMTSDLENEEYLFEKGLTSKIAPKLRLELSRTDVTNSNEDKVARILGGIS